MIRYRCAICGEIHTAEDSDAGTRRKCPACNRSNYIPFPIVNGETPPKLDDHPDLLSPPAKPEDLSSISLPTGLLPNETRPRKPIQRASQPLSGQVRGSAPSVAGPARATAASQTPSSRSAATKASSTPHGLLFLEVVCWMTAFLAGVGVGLALWGTWPVAREERFVLAVGSGIAALLGAVLGVLCRCLIRQHHRLGEQARTIRALQTRLGEHEDLDETAPIPRPGKKSIFLASEPISSE